MGHDFISTVSVECCYQNTGIATSVAITMFKGEELTQAIGVPLFYGLVEAIVLGIYCIVAWKFGWTKAPPNESFCVAIAKSYEVETAQVRELTGIEVVLGSPKSDEVVFEIDDSTRSVNDESGSIYGISYPTPTKKQQIEKYTIDERHRRTILFPIAGSPEVDIDIGDLELEFARRREDFNNFLVNANANATFQNIRDIEKGEKLDDKLSKASTKQKKSTNMMKIPETSPFSLEQKQTLLSDNISKEITSNKNETENELSAPNIQNYHDNIIKNGNCALTTTQNKNSEITSDSTSNGQEDNNVTTDQPSEIKSSTIDYEIYTSSTPIPQNDNTNSRVQSIMNKSIEPQTIKSNENFSLSTCALPNNDEVGTDISIEMESKTLSDEVTSTEFETSKVVETQIQKDTTKRT